MKKSVLVYWSGTGNTQDMAEHIAAGLRAAGAEVDVFNVSDTTAQEVAGYDSILLGCPAMGAEVLEESEFEPFFTELEPLLSGKKLALFGSYGWGDGEWMREWEKRTARTGGVLFEPGLILNEAPDTRGIADCEAFGRRFANS